MESRPYCGVIQLAGEEFRYLAIAKSFVPAGLERLSTSERRIVLQVVDGLSTAAIARTRRTSPNTVANQLGSIFIKLEVSNRHELIRVALGAPGLEYGPWATLAQLLKQESDFLLPPRFAEPPRWALRAMVQDSLARNSWAESLPALDTWRGILTGRLTVVDSFCEGAQRVLMTSESKWQGAGVIPYRQRQVLFYSSLGWSNKEIGFLLGTNASTISTHLARGLKSLGLARRSELIQLASVVTNGAVQTLPALFHGRGDVMTKIASG